MQTSRVFWQSDSARLFGGCQCGRRGGNPMPKPAPSELAEHSTSVEHSLRPGYLMPDTPSRRVCFYDSQTVSDLLVEYMADGAAR